MTREQVIKKYRLKENEIMTFRQDVDHYDISGKSVIDAITEFSKRNNIPIEETKFEIENFDYSAEVTITGKRLRTKEEYEKLIQDCLDREIANEERMKQLEKENRKLRQEEELREYKRLKKKFEKNAKIET